MNERNNAATIAAVTRRTTGTYGRLDKPNLHHITKVSSLFFCGNNGSVLCPHCDHSCSLPHTVQEPSLMKNLPLEDPQDFSERGEGTLENGLHIQCGRIFPY